MKRFLALILAAAMALALVPAVALADEGTGTWTITATKTSYAVDAPIAASDFTAVYNDGTVDQTATIDSVSLTAAPSAAGAFTVDVTASYDTFTKTETKSLTAYVASGSWTVTATKKFYNLNAAVDKSEFSAVYSDGVQEYPATVTAIDVATTGKTAGWMTVTAELSATVGSDTYTASKTVSIYATGSYPAFVVLRTAKNYAIGDTITPVQSFYTAYYVTSASAAYDVTTSTSINKAGSYTCKQPGPATLTIRYTRDGKTYETGMSIAVAATVNTLAVRLSAAGEEKALNGWYVGDTLKKEYFIVEYTLAGSDAPTVLAEADYTMSISKLGTGNSQNITFTYRSTPCVFNIAGIKSATEPKLVVTGTPSTTYGLGADFKHDELTVYYQAANTDVQQQLTYGTTPGTGVYTATPSTFNKAGVQSVVLSYTDAAGVTVTHTIKVTVTAMYTKLVLDGKLTNTFYAGDAFDPAGLTAKLYKYDGTYTTETLTKDSVDYRYSVSALKAGTQDVTITYREPSTLEEVSAKVSVTAGTTVKKLAYSGTIPTFYVGDSFSPHGITFTVSFFNKADQTLIGTTDLAYAGLSWPTKALVKTDTAVRVTYTDPLTKETAYVDVPVTVADPTAAKLEASLATADLKAVVGDAIDPDKLFKVFYKAKNSSETKQLSYANGDYTISPLTSTFATAGEQTFTFTKDGLTATATVSVLPVVKSMTFAGTLTKKHMAGDTFDPSGLTITVAYNVGSLWTLNGAGDEYTERPGIKVKNGYPAKEIAEAAVADWNSEGITFPTDKLMAGWQSIAITYQDANYNGSKTTDYYFTVSKKLAKLEVTNPSDTVKFTAGSYFDPTGLTVAVTDTNGKPVTGVTTADLYFDPMLLEAGNRTIVLEYTDTDSGETVSYTFGFKVVAETYTFKSINTTSVKKAYTEGEMFSPAGLSMVVENSKGTEITVTSGTPGFMVYPDRPLTQSDTSVVVVYNDVAQTITGITVAARTLKTIAVTTKPTAASCYVGQVFDPTGMVVTATYGNKTTSEVSGYTYPTTAFTESDIGTKTLEIAYKEGTVTAKTSLTVTVTAAPIKVSTVILDVQTLNTTASLKTQLKASVQPTNATNSGIAWSSSNTAVATVDQAGNVTGVAKGTCVVTATSTDGSGRYADCFVTVAAKVGVTKVTISASTNELLVAGTTTLTAAITPETATQSSVVWASSNEAVATVDEKGLVTAYKLGNTNITATADGVTATLPFAVVTELSRWGTVANCTRRVNVRANADGSSTAVGYAYLGSTYRVIGESGNWYQIAYTSGSRTTAYIWKNYMTVTNTLASTNTGTTGGTATDGTGTGTGTGTSTGGTVTESGTIGDIGSYTKLTVVNCLRYVYVRNGANTTFSKIGHAKPGEVYKLTGKSGNWYIIDYKGTVGYIYGQFGKLS